MRVVIQRVSEASVTVDGKVTGAIGKGLLVLAGFEDSDTADDLRWMASKLVNLRIFPDDAGVMNRSLIETEGELLIVSQFTLHGMTKKGNRPSYIRAARPEVAIPLYESFITECQSLINPTIRTGIFGADMKVALINDGPVTITIDSKSKE